MSELSELKKVKVTPKEGLQIRKTNGQIMAATGADVILNKYYRQCIKDGDLIRVDTVALNKTTKAAKQLEAN